MDSFLLISILLCILVSWSAIRLLITRRPNKLPPGPTSLPILGSLLSVGPKPHQSLARLAAVHGPIISLRLGTLTTVVVSSPSAAKEFLQNNDAIFCNRTVPDSLTALRHNEFSLVFSPASSHWRTLRKICNCHVFSTARLDSSEDIRRKKLDEMLAHVDKAKRDGEAVDIGQVAFNTAINLLSNTFFSVDLVGPGSEDSREMKEVVWQMMVEAGNPNLSDYFPRIRWLDIQGIRGRMEMYIEKMLGVFTSLIDRRLGDDAHADALDALIKICREKTEQLQLSHISRLLLDLFVAGTDTMSSTVEWAMTELFSNPMKMKKTRQELEDVIGKGVRVKEEDMSKLPYLQCVIKETLRLHPPAPLLVPRKSPSDTDVSVCGFTVPRNSQVLVNVWAMGRDPGLWENPTRFEPERFMDNKKKIDFKGQDFELIPFGAGRRICPGLPLATRVLPLMLGSLVNCFEWKFEGESLDMEDKFGITLRKAQPLRAIPVIIDV